MKKLFWVETHDHFEDWFIVATSIKKACSCHENFEGFNKGDANADFICNIPSPIVTKYKTEFDDLDDGYWPSLEMLKELGFDFIEDQPPYVARGFGRLFYEGKSALASVLQDLEDKNGVYVVNIRDTNKFKIGITKNINRRLREFKTSNPFTIDLWYFIETSFPRKVERQIHETLNLKRYSGEWFELKIFGDILLAIEDIDKDLEIKIYNVLNFIEKL